MCTHIHVNVHIQLELESYVVVSSLVWVLCESSICSYYPLDISTAPTLCFFKCY